MPPKYQKLLTNEQNEPGEDDYSHNATHSNHISNNALSSSTAANVQEQQQRVDLQDSFGESFDEEEEEEQEETDVLLRRDHHEPLPSSLPSSSTIELQVTSTANTRNNNIHHNHHAAPVISNDGVFANMSAKPESDNNKLDETPPTYEEASADATPPYWQTTVIAPAGMGNVILVEGMPVGSILSFFWNLLVSASFQFIGFMLTYLLHTSHASKQGSRAGLGVSLVQTGFYIRSRGSLDNDDYGGEDSSSSSKSDTGDSSDSQSTDADIVAYFLMMIGWFIIIRSLADYFKANQMQRIICAEPEAATPAEMV